MICDVTTMIRVEPIEMPYFWKIRKDGAFIGGF
jgi:hypothetical protein